MGDFAAIFRCLVLAALLLGGNAREAVPAQGNIYVNTEGLDFGLVSRQRLARIPDGVDFVGRTFLVGKREGRFAILSITTDLPMLQVDPSPPAGPSGLFLISASLDGNKLKPGRITGSILIDTDDPATPHLVLPVRGEIRD